MTFSLASSAPATAGTLAVGFVVINVAVIGLFGGILWYLIALDRRSGRQRAGASNPTTISRLPDGGVVPAALVGVAGAGSRGVLTSPVTKTPCVWYRVELYQRSADVTALISSSARSTVKKVRELVSEGTVRVVDETGAVQVGPGDIAPDPEWLADARKTGRRPKPGELFLHADNGVLTDGYEQREYVIPVDARVTVIGGLSRHGDRLVRGADVPEFVVSRKSPEQAAAASARGGRTMRRTVWALGVVGVVGLVFGNGLMVYAMNAAS
jgi:hypothetical protein